MYDVKCKRWERQYCRMGWAQDGKAEFSYSVFNLSVRIFGSSDFSCKEKNLQHLFCLAFMSSLYLVVIYTVDTLVVFQHLLCVCILFQEQRLDTLRLAI